MAGQLESAIDEIRLMYDSFRSLMAISPNLPPDCVVECLKKFFRNCNRPLFTNGSSRAQIKIMKNLKTAFEAYQTLAKMSPKSAPAALIKTLGTILTVSNLVKVETNGEESDCSVEIIDEETFQNDNYNNYNNNVVNNDVEYQENAAATNSDGVLYTDEPVQETVPSTSFSSRHKQLQELVKNWVNGVPIPSPISTPTSSSSQVENNVMELASENTADLETNRENADETVPNGDSSLSSFNGNGNSSHSIQNEQQNDMVAGKLTHRVYRRRRGKQYSASLPKDSSAIYKCSHGCGKTFRSEMSRYYHENILCGGQILKCDFCDFQFTTRQAGVSHQRACRNPVEKADVKHVTSCWRCEFCGTKFANAQVLERHRAIYTQDSLKKCRFTL